jgi:hypothetical protein
VVAQLMQEIQGHEPHRHETWRISG